jgi:hypothetical protein
MYRVRAVTAGALGRIGPLVTARVAAGLDVTPLGAVALTAHLAHVAGGGRRSAVHAVAAGAARRPAAGRDARAVDARSPLRHDVRAGSRARRRDAVAARAHLVAVRAVREAPRVGGRQRLVRAVAVDARRRARVVLARAPAVVGRPIERLRVHREAVGRHLLRVAVAAAAERGDRDARGTGGHAGVTTRRVDLRVGAAVAGDAAHALARVEAAGEVRALARVADAAAAGAGVRRVQLVGTRERHRALAREPGRPRSHRLGRSRGR